MFMAATSEEYSRFRVDNPLWWKRQKMLNLQKAHSPSLLAGRWKQISQTCAWTSREAAAGRRSTPITVPSKKIASRLNDMRGIGVCV